jgi:hypothetical protein
MAGSYSKAMYLMLLSTFVPFYTSLFIGLFNPTYFFWLLAAGIVISVVAVVGNSVYGLLHFQTYANLGTTIQYRDNRDKYEDITWTGDYSTMGPFRQKVKSKDNPSVFKEQVFTVAAIKTEDGREWLIFFLHAFGQLAFTVSDVITDWTIAKIRTAYITTVFLKAWHRALADDEIKRPNWFQQHFLHEPPAETSKAVTALFAYGTTVTGRDVIEDFQKRIEHDYTAPSERVVDDAFKHYAVEQLWLIMDEAKSQKQTIDDLHTIAMDGTELKIEIGHETVNEEAPLPWKTIIKYLAIVVVVIVVIVVVYKYLGII